jgi:uncharacterized UBP type Zn finger protein
MDGKPDSGKTRSMTAVSPCSHEDQVKDDVTPQGDACAECVAAGQTWVQLRLCLSCGHVGCCEQSKGNHAAAHAFAAEHPIVRSLEPGTSWRWCYVDETYLI